MDADGSIIIESRIDNAKAEKELDKLTRKIEATELKLSKKTTERNQIAEQLREASKEAMEAYAHVEQLQKTLKESMAITSIEGPSVNPLVYGEELEKQKQIKEELAAQENILRKKELAAEKLAKKDAELVEKLEEQTAELNKQKNAAGKIADQLSNSEKESGLLANAMNGVTNRIDKLSNRISKLASRVFVFSLITMALRGMRTWLEKVIKTNDEASSAISRLKGALLTLAQPLVNVIIPALTILVNILTRIVTAIASFVSMLFGKTLSQSKKTAETLNKEAEASNGVGSAAKEAASSLAGFDEINQLASDTAGGGTSGTISPDFGFDTGTMEADFEKLLNWIKLIGATLGALKLGTGFLDSLQKFLGLLLAIHGGINLARDTWDAWQNGVTWDNFKNMLIDAAELIAGLAIAFGPIGAAIGFIVSGLVLLATGFHDAMENGWNLQNLLMSIAGIMGTGIGIGILTGSFIPLLIAAIASLLLALAVATGHGEELLEGVRMVCQGFLDFITGIFAGDIEKALSGINTMFEGLHMVVNAVIGGVRDTILGFLDWLDEKTGGQFHNVIEAAKKQVTEFFGDIEAFAGDFIDAIEDIFRGLIEFISGVLTNDWDLAWKGMKDLFKGNMNSIVALAEGFINAIIGGLNNITGALKKLSAFKLPDWAGGYSFSGISILPQFSKVSLPRLATGAVIPPNREFMAVLGDQRSGNNIETPESLLRQIFREESGSAEMLAVLQAILDAVKSGKVMMVDKRVLARIAAEGINDMTIAAGKPVLLI